MEALQEVVNEHDLYPVHEEDSVPETPAHFFEMRYLVGAVQAQRPDLWVTGDTCLYWERGNMKRYVAPDVAVIDSAPPAEPENVYLLWKDPPLLFVGEIGSRSSLKPDTGPKVTIYERRLQVLEYLYCDPPTGDLRLWRMVNGRYRLTSRDDRGYVWSEQLTLWFGYDAAGFLRIYTPDGEMLLTQEEERRAREQAQRDRDEAQRDRDEAQRDREQEQRAREEAEQALEQAEKDREQERRAREEERQRRADAERRVAELEAELARLRHRPGGT